MYLDKTKLHDLIKKTDKLDTYTTSKWDKYTRL
ncbi:hypothetical protein SAMN05216167_102329 [Spirosoma endophyticum]|uniref:Uncharacterized protein n=1 Tax=Spirosoma endophyticum TaxID=662367 RepID=A0A1I1LRA3_9BACT|nr:hypothetical protein SAMN05216167_102329 [Spirosoma endophyticum]